MPKKSLKQLSEEIRSREYKETVREVEFEDWLRNKNKCKGCLWLDEQDQNYNLEPCCRCNESNNEFVDEASLIGEWNNGHWDDSGD